MLTKSNATNSAVVALVSASVVAAAGWLMYRERKRRLMDAYWNGEFVRVGSVQQLFVHPLKSGRAIEASWLDCTERGARFDECADREFLIVDAAHECVFLTGREYPKIVLITSVVKNRVLTLTFPSSLADEGGGDAHYDEAEEEAAATATETVDVDLAEVLARAHIRRAKLYRGGKTDGYDCGDRVADALTNFLGVAGKREIRLLYFSDALFTERDVPSDADSWLNPVPALNVKMAFADLSSYMAFGASSLADLNERLTAAGEALVDARCFRPNFVIAADVPAYDEDRWLCVRIGDGAGAGAEFACHKACTRCMFVTIDPNTGEKSRSGEPLRELRRYRLPPPGAMRAKYGEKAVFGAYMSLARAGRVRVGDAVSVRYKPSAF